MEFVAFVQNLGGTTTLLGQGDGVLFQSVNLDAIVTVDDVEDALVVEVSSLIPIDMRWVASVRTAEVGWPALPPPP